MLTLLITLLVLGSLATWVVTLGAVRASRRLGIDWTVTLLWLGLAEWPPEDGVPTRAQLAAARAEARRARTAAA